MGNREQTVLLVSNDAEFCAALRKEFSLTAGRVRVTAVSSLDAARRLLEEDLPAVILLEEDAVAAQSDRPRGRAPSLEAMVAPLAIHAPVVVIGSPEKREELSGLIDADAVDFVAREGESLRTALRMMERRLRQARQRAASATESLPDSNADEDFGEVLRHELNNPLTGILGNAELLLAEIHRKNDGQIPEGGEQRLETIAALAVRLRETVRRLSQEWEARQHPVP
jgi:signal transduction histidine kinase